MILGLVFAEFYLLACQVLRPDEEVINDVIDLLKDQMRRFIKLVLSSKKSLPVKKVHKKRRHLKWFL